MKKYIFALLLIAGAALASTNEISVSTTLKVNKDALQLTRNTGTLLIQMAGTRFNSQTITATTTNQILTKGSVSNCGWYYFRNLSTNPTAIVYITFDAGATTSHCLKAKEPAVGRLATDAIVTNFTVSANAGTVDVEFTVIED